MIKLILSLIVIICLGVYTIFSELVCFFIHDKNKLSNYYFHVVSFTINIVLKICNTKIVIKNPENLKKVQGEKSIFVVSNHRGYFDILSGYIALNRNCSIVAKNSLEKVPIIGFWMKKINCIFLDRKNLRSGAKMIIDAVNLIEKGISVWIFPEGTRNKNEDPEDLLPFKPGAFKIPDKTNCYILPMAIVNSELVFEKQFPIIKSATIYINFGRPYKMSELSKEDVYNIDEYNMTLFRKLIKELKER